MQKKWFHNKYFYTLLTVLASGFGLMLIFLMIFAHNAFQAGLRHVLTILAPILYGFCMAYILNPMMNYIEQKVISPFATKFISKLDAKKKQAILRNISMVLTFFIFILCIILFFKTLVPDLISSIETFAKAFPTYADNTMNWFNSILADYPEERKIVEVYLDDYSEELESFFSTKLIPYMQDYLKQITSNLFNTMIGLVKVVFNFVVGIFVSIYLLSKKEHFAAQSKKIIYSVFSEKLSNAIIYEVRFIHTTFTNFFTGKILDSLIVGLVCFLVTTIMGTPYALLVSLFVGITNIIPVFGPFIGAIPSTFIILMVNPRAALFFVIFVLILQQIDGNILGPKILGDSIGLPTFWVLFSIIVFGGMFGVFGILIGVPAFAVIYDAIKRLCKYRLHLKGLPEATTPYTYVDKINEGHLHLITDPAEESAKEGVVITIKRDE